ncbi:MAG TPA: DUF6350 family protein [Microbacterium sp.]|nr:DUF6350 family protein [Microbacterium sp.]
MHRLIVVILSAVDAAIAAAVGIAATLAPLTLLWVLALGGSADWAALWPASATIWQFGNLVPLQVTLPGDYLAVAGIDPAAASFVLSLAPLAFAGFTAIFAARSGVRASQADAWIIGVVTGTLAFAALATLVALTSAASVAQVELWQAILLPALVFAVPLLGGAIVTEWREAGAGAIARLRDRIEATPHGWGEVPGLVVRGTAVVLAGLIGLGALMFAVSLVLRGGEVIALFEVANVDLLGATVVTLAQLAYLPTLAIWGMAFVAGPGFAVGVDTAVSPAGTQLGVIPGIPVLGALPESTTPWLLLLALLPVALGAFAGWIARSRLVASPADIDAEPPHVPIEWDAAREAARSSTLTALLSGVDATRGSAASASDGVATDVVAVDEHADPIGARAVIAIGIAAFSAVGAAALSLLASGSIGPGRLAEVGPQPGPVALAVGVEVLLGAAILLLSPRRAKRPRKSLDSAGDAAPGAADELPADGGRAEIHANEVDTAPITLVPPAPSGAADGPDSTSTAELGPRRPAPLPPID